MSTDSSVQQKPSRRLPVRSPIHSVSHNANPDGRRDEDSRARSERRVLILYVGGTIGMLPGKSGELMPSKGYLKAKINAMGELRGRPEIAQFDLVEYDKLLDSSDMGESDYMNICLDIASNYDDYDGFLILQGTDTMHYTAGALSFQLQNLDKPVIITGAMIPLMEAYNDARRNFVTGLMIASSPVIREVCIFFKDRLLRGNRCCKLHHTFGAFESPNYPALGILDGDGFHLHEQHLLPRAQGPLTIESKMTGRVLVLVAHPGWDSKTAIQLLDGVTVAGETTEEQQSKRPVDAVVLEVSGFGDVEGAFSQTLREIARVGRNRGILICVTSREPFVSPRACERLHMEKISPDLIYLSDMLSSTAEVKLMYLFGKGLSSEEVAHFMPLNLRGEVSSIPVAKL